MHHPMLRGINLERDPEQVLQLMIEELHALASTPPDILHDHRPWLGKTRSARYAEMRRCVRLISEALAHIQRQDFKVVGV